MATAKTGAKGTRRRVSLGAGQSKVRLTARDWADAALEAMRDSGSGLAAIAVEPLALRLGTTKGSFYWHFANRDALVTATLERWAETDTERVIELVSQERDPRARFQRLFAHAVAASAEDPVELALLAHAQQSQVAAVLERVTTRRVDYLAELLGELGFSGEQARDRALMGYCAYLGHTQLALSVPGALPQGEVAHERYVDTVVDLLLDAGDV